MGRSAFEGEIREDFTHDRGEFVAMPTETCGERYALLFRVFADDEMLIVSFMGVLIQS